MNLRPLYDHVLVRRVSGPKASPGGIIIPDVAQERGAEADVLAVGSGKILENGTVRPLELKVGDRVWLAKWGGAEVKIGEDDCLMLREDEILAVRA